MTNVFYTKESKSLLAKLMAEEDISVRHEKIDTAYFDVKNRVLAIPIWKEMSNDLYDLFVGHEVGHALYTPSDPEVLKEAYSRSNQSFINVIEDARIEKFMKRKFLGLRTAFVKGYRELCGRNFFEMNEKSPEQVAFIDRINYYFKTGTANTLVARDWFSEDEMTWIERIEKLETFDEVADLSEELYAYLKEKQENQETQSGDGQSQDGEGETQMSGSQNNDSSDGSEQEKVQTQTDGNGDDDEHKDETSDESSKGTQSSTDTSEGVEQSTTAETQTGTEGGQGPIDELSSSTDNVASQNMQDMIDRNAKDITYVNIGNSYDWTKHVQDYKEVIPVLRQQLHDDVFDENLYNQFLADNKTTIGYLVKEFEMKKSADAHARSLTAASGQINSSKLWSYKINEDIFKKKTIVPDGKNHGMVMLVDWSGSMHGNLYETVRQTVTLASFCRRVGIPFDVYAFNDNGFNDIPYDLPLQTAEEGDIIIPASVNLRCYVSSRMNANEFKKSCNIFLNAAKLIDTRYYGGNWKIDGLSGTPLDDALLIMDKLIYKFRSENALQKVNLVVLTDGESGSCPEYKQTGEYNGEEFVRGAPCPTRYWSRNQGAMVCRDKQTKKTFVKNYGENYTDFLLKMLKEKHGINTIGFYLVGGHRGDIKLAVQRYVAKNYYDVAPLSRKLRKEKFLVCDTTGYDNYYIIMSVDAKTEDLNVNSDMTKNKIAKAFMSHNASKKTNRQLLNKFVDLVK